MHREKVKKPLGTLLKQGVKKNAQNEKDIFARNIKILHYTYICKTVFEDHNLINVFCTSGTKLNQRSIKTGKVYRQLFN